MRETGSGQKLLSSPLPPTPHFLSYSPPPLSPRTLFSSAAFLSYAATAVAVILLLIFYVAPTHGTSNLFVFIGICSLAGSLSVMSCKVRRNTPQSLQPPTHSTTLLTPPPPSLTLQALGIALKLTFQGDNQLIHIETYFCIAVSHLRILA
jgi:hypothetical protein